jgi:DNA-binding MarR family transcriptional regulator
MAATSATSTRDPLPAGTAGLEAWKTLVIAHSRLFRALDEQMSAEHGRSLGDYDVLVQLASAPGQSLRMCDLASAVLLSPSGLSRRVERLERDGLVERRRAEGDGRNIEATLTSAGRRLFRRLQTTHHEGIKELFADEFSDGELDALSELLGRLEPERPATDC